MRHVFKIVYSMGRDELAQLARQYGLPCSGTKQQIADNLVACQSYLASIFGHGGGGDEGDGSDGGGFGSAKFLDLNAIGPNENNWYDKSRASKLVIIAKPGTGKSVTIASIMYHMRHKIPYGIVINGTEDTSQEFGAFFPTTFVYDSYSEEPIRKLIARQKALIQARKPNPWAILVINDCAHGGFFKSALQQELYKNARHWYILYIVALQYAKDIPLMIRAAVDMTFILRENNKIMRRIMYDNYGSVIPTFAEFDRIMTQFCTNYGMLVIDNMSNTETWQQNVFWYKCPDLTKVEWRFGHDSFWEYHWQISGQKPPTPKPAIAQFVEWYDRENDNDE